VIGQTIAHYRVQEKIGAGGMGEVYRAQDTRLCRDVALKVLPELFARDAERMVRFEREAKVLASLNHPNIASIYGLEESNRTRALVMELVEGPTFAERIRQGRIPLEEVLTFAKQIADALEYAHERSIIHRDLRPSNVKLTPESPVKLLDFGLAKALEGETVEPELQNSSTPSAPSTRTGVLLGTAAYMSPEQARGKRVDRRADIWAFGCMLYEMLTGRAAFTGETTSDILASVICAEPDWSALPGWVSSHAYPRTPTSLFTEGSKAASPRHRRRTDHDPRSPLRFRCLRGGARHRTHVDATPGDGGGLSLWGPGSGNGRGWICRLVFAPYSQTTRDHPLRVLFPRPGGTTRSIGWLRTQRFSGCGYLSGRLGTHVRWTP